MGNAGEAAISVCPQQELLVLGFIHIFAITIGPEPPYSAHPRGMREIKAGPWTTTDFWVCLSKKIAAYRVAASTEDNDTATHKINFRVAFQIFHLNIQTLGISNIAAIHTRKIFPATQSNGLIQSDGKPHIFAI